MEATYVSLSEISGFEFYESELFKSTPWVWLYTLETPYN